MSDLGLRYGEEFRPIRELSAGGGQVGWASGVVGCDCAARGRICAASGALRRSAPGVLCRRGDGRGSASADEAAGAFRAHSLPGLSGASSRVSRGCRNLATIFSKATSASTTRGEALRAGGWFPRDQPVRRGPLRAPGGTRDLTYHVAWERTPNESLEQALAAASACVNCTSAAQSAFDQVVAMRGRRTGGGALRPGRTGRRATRPRTARDGRDSERSHLMRRHCGSRRQCAGHLSG